MPARRVSRAALGVAVLAGVVACAALGLPAMATSVAAPAGASGPGRAEPAADGSGPLTTPPPPGTTAAPDRAAPDRTVPDTGAPHPAAPDPAAPTPQDRRAGILRRTVAASGTGEFDVAPGSVPAPGAGAVHVVRVQVERGLPVDRDVFAAFVLTVLNDPRGWGHGGTMSFARTDGDAPITVVLASPDTSARLCGDVEGGGRLSCRNGPLAVLTFERWVDGTDEYADNLTGYRQYVVNHEVGHALGHGHELCPGPGRPAPVMQQQTLGLHGCTENSWPYPDPPRP